jgi:hypothetical protein
VDLQLGFPGSWARLVPQALSEVLAWWQKATRSATANEGGDSSHGSSTSHAWGARFPGVRLEILLRRLDILGGFTTLQKLNHNSQ